MSIKKKLMLILCVFSVIYVVVAGVLLWNAKQANIRVHIAEASFEELFAVFKMRSVMVAQVLRAIEYLLIIDPKWKTAYEKNGLSVIKAQADWVATIQKQIALGEMEDAEIELSEEVKRMYSNAKRQVEDAFEAADAGDMDQAYYLLEDIEERWINQMLRKKVDTAETKELHDINNAFDDFLISMGIMPWVASRNKKEIRLAKSSLEYFIRADRLLSNIEIQFHELMDYLVSGNEREIGEFEEHGMDADANFIALGKLSKTHEYHKGESHQMAMERVADIENKHNNFDMLADKVMAIKKAGQLKELVRFVDNELRPYIDNILHKAVSQEIEHAKNDIHESIQKLFRATYVAGFSGVVVIGIVLVLIAITVVSLVRGIIIPLEKLRKGTEMIGAGHLDHRIGLKKKDELGRLAISFDDMAGTLQKSREELMNAKEYIDKIFGSMCDTLIVVSPAGDINKVNGAACALLDYKEEDLIGRPVDTIISEGLPVKQGIHACEIGTTEKTYRARDGRRINVLFTSSAMHDDDGNLAGIVCVAQDITQQKEEARIKKQLERRLFVSEKMATVSQMAAGLAHQIRNPLASIDVNLKNLEDEYKMTNGAGNAHSKYFSIIASEVERLNLELEEFLKSVVPKEKTDGVTVCSMDDVLKEAVQKTATALEEKKINLKTSSIVRGLHIECEFEQLSRAFANMLQNAIDAVPPAGVITIETLNSGPTVNIKICDNGCGISAEELDRIFDFYFSTKERGMGIGLAFARLTIEQHEGNINVESEKGNGTCFIVTLPIRQGMSHE